MIRRRSEARRTAKALKDRSQTYPILLTRTPYGASGKKYGSDNLPEKLGFFGREWLTRVGFIFVEQDDLVGNRLTRRASRISLRRVPNTLGWCGGMGRRYDSNSRASNT